MLDQGVHDRIRKEVQEFRKLAEDQVLSAKLLDILTKGCVSGFPGQLDTSLVDTKLLQEVFLRNHASDAHLLSTRQLVEIAGFIRGK